MKSIYEFLLKSKTVSSTQNIDYVDLELPSGRLWATCNLGAVEPADPGDYFMWGSTKPNTADNCCWKTAPFNDGLDVFNEQYFTSIKDNVCPNGILSTEYDAVNMLIGNGWRMPTKYDANELIAMTTHEWVNDYENSGMCGMILRSKINENTIFFPTGGALIDKSYVLGHVSYLWTSTIYNTNNYACYMRLRSVTARVSDKDICSGLNIRGVK